MYIENNHVLLPVIKKAWKRHISPD